MGLAAKQARAHPLCVLSQVLALLQHPYWVARAERIGPALGALTYTIWVSLVQVTESARTHSYHAINAGNYANRGLPAVPFSAVNGVLGALSCFEVCFRCFL